MTCKSCKEVKAEFEFPMKLEKGKYVRDDKCKDCKEKRAQVNYFIHGL